MKKSERTRQVNGRVAIEVYSMKRKQRKQRKQRKLLKQIANTYIKTNAYQATRGRKYIVWLIVWPMSEPRKQKAPHALGRLSPLRDVNVPQTLERFMELGPKSAFSQNVSNMLFVSI